MGIDRENVVPGNLCIIWKLNEAWPLEKNCVTCLPLLKLLKLKKTPPLLHDLKFSILKRGLCHFLMTLKFLIPKKDSITFLGLSEFLTLEKDSITSLRLLNVLVLKNDSITFLRHLEFFKIAILVNSRWWRSLIISYLWLTNIICSESPIS